IWQYLEGFRIGELDLRINCRVAPLIDIVAELEHRIELFRKDRPIRIVVLDSSFAVAPASIGDCYAIGLRGNLYFIVVGATDFNWLTRSFRRDDYRTGNIHGV